MRDDRGRGVVLALYWIHNPHSAGLCTSNTRIPANLMSTPQPNTRLTVGAAAKIRYCHPNTLSRTIRDSALPSVWLRSRFAVPADRRAANQVFRLSGGGSW